MKKVILIILIFFSFSFNSCLKVDEKLVENRISNKQQNITNKHNDVFTVTTNIDSLFSKYPATNFTEKLVNPKFQNSRFKTDEKYVKFITDEIKNTNKTNLAGNYTGITHNCGLGCVSLFIINRETGQILEDLPQELNEENNGIEFRRDSKLIIKNSNSINNQTDTIFKPEYFLIENNIVKKINIS